MASDATAHSGLLGAQMATRSPGSTPRASKHPAARSTRSASSANVQRTPAVTSASSPPNRAAARASAAGIVGGAPSSWSTLLIPSLVAAVFVPRGDPHRPYLAPKWSPFVRTFRIGGAPFGVGHRLAQALGRAA